MINLSEYKNIHCIGIGGIGLSAIAEILLARGYKVSGSDMVESDITEKLSKAGAKIYIGHRRENLKDADLVVYSAAIAEQNPEIMEAREKGLAMASRAEILGILMDEFPESIAVSGTHGKTTTTSMVSLILNGAKCDPTILVGGNLEAIGGNVKIGKSPYFITEACEYRDSFLSLRPQIELVLNIDSDHLDYFKDINHIVDSFEKFATNIKKGGKLIAFGANPFVRKVISKAENYILYGYSNDCDYIIKDVEFNEKGLPAFTIEHRGEETRVELSVPGEHNILNATAAFACTRELGIEAEVISKILSEYKGTHRRFDITGTTKNGVMIVDDYAHHPTEIKATLEAAGYIPHNKLWCLFQPHTYTRTLALFDQFAESFEKADVLVVADIYAAREKNIYNITSEKLVEKIREVSNIKEVLYIDNFEDIAKYVLSKAEAEDLVITMGAGDIYKVGQRMMENDGI